MHKQGYQCSECNCIVVFKDETELQEFFKDPQKKHKSSHGVMCDKGNYDFELVSDWAGVGYITAEWIREPKRNPYGWYIRCSSCHKNMQKFSEETEYVTACQFYQATQWQAWCDVCKQDTQWSHGSFVPDPPQLTLKDETRLNEDQQRQAQANESDAAHMIEEASRIMKDTQWHDAPPIPIRLHCPECHALHIDTGEFATKPHHTHACQSCGHVWRPAIINTVGVQFLPGFKNA